MCDRNKRKDDRRNCHVGLHVRTPSRAKAQGIRLGP
jgi:hypothetical protein